MGNLDKVVVFNRSFAFLIRGQEYQTESEIIPLAVARFLAEAEESIKLWYHAQKENPATVDEHYRAEEEREITSIEVYDLHN